MMFATSRLAALAALLLAGASAFPNAPFSTEGRWIVDSKGDNFTYMGVNWPGAADTMLPEGLQYQSVATIVGKIKTAGFNSIRLTFAIEMIDQIYENGGTDIPISTAFVNALGQQNGTAVFNKVLASNPSFSQNTTRLQVFDAVAEECNKQGIYVHLDNHISTGEWCCGGTDGNGWFGDTDFSVANWTRGLEYMVTHGKAWPSLVSIGLRNELRPPGDNWLETLTSYNWPTWYSNMRKGADAVNAANPDVLVFLGGINSDTTLYPIPTGSSLGSGISFDVNSFAYKDKLVLELHNYQNSASSCPVLEAELYVDGYAAMDVGNASIKNVMPVVMTEFGYAQDQGDVASVYASCLRSYLPSQRGGWMYWVVAGSYYIRTGTQDDDEAWGLFNHDWSDYRDASVFAAGVGALIKASSSA